MSRASERKAMVEAVRGYSLMGVPEMAAVLGCEDRVAHEMVERGAVPSVTVGKRKKVDPVDLAVYILAEKEGCTAPEYWARYSESDVLENARRFYRHARRVAAA